MRIVFATGNEHKLEEIRDILSGELPADTEIVSMKQADLDCDPEEDGDTFADNALIKVRAVSELARQRYASEEMPFIMADDSGLCIDYLNGEPGIYSARFMGHDTPYEEKNRAIIERMKDVTGADRSARFTCAVAVMMPDGEAFTVTESMEGEIAFQPAGCGGFGYDPIFYLREYGCTDAELKPGEKNRISHRGKALRAAVKELKNRGIIGN